MKDELIDKAIWKVKRDKSIQVLLKTVKWKERFIAVLIMILFSVMSFILLINFDSAFFASLITAFMASVAAFYDFYKACFYNLHSRIV